MKRTSAWVVMSAMLGSGLGEGTTAAAGDPYRADLAFLKKHTQIVELSGRSGKARIAVAPQLQGRVMTSTASGMDGLSFGWINRELFTSGERRPHINPYGGEDRLWLGPEGGQFSIFFPPGAPFEFAHWQTPAALDTEPFAVETSRPGEALFRRDLTLTNYSRSRFVVHLERRIRVLESEEMWRHLGVKPVPDLDAVAYETVNRITNAGDTPWTRDSGMLSIWILGMYNATPATTVVVPYREGSEAKLGKVVESAYFGQIPADRLVVRNGRVYFRADAQFRSKIGVSPRRAKPILGSYDGANAALTLVQFTLPEDPRDYVNSLWKHQDQPFAGDAANSYNDGPNETGKALGNFYELESSSPAANLAPGASLEHVHRTFHLVGQPHGLDRTARAVLGASLKEIQGAFKVAR